MMHQLAIPQKQQEHVHHNSFTIIYIHTSCCLCVVVVVAVCSALLWASHDLLIHTCTYGLLYGVFQLLQALVLPTFGCCILLILVPIMVLTLCKLHLWDFFWSTSANTALALMVVITCNLRWWPFSCYQLEQILHLHLWWSLPATCTGGVFMPTAPFY